MESNSRHTIAQMVFAKKGGIYFGTDIIKYPFKIIQRELGINCKF